MESKYYCFTVFGEEPPTWNPEIMSYLIWGAETCPETGRDHYQCYVEFGTKKRLTYLKKNFDPKIHWEGRRGTAEQAATYCKKEENFEEYGTISKPHQGRDTELNTVVELIKAGEITNISQVAQEHCSVMIRYHKGIMACLNERQEDNTIETLKVEVHWGASGTGKSHYAWTTYPNLYSFEYNNNAIWWDGYMGQEVVLFDEFTGKIPIETILKYLDKWPMKLPIKGSTTIKKWKTVIICSNINPNKWYPYAQVAQKEALARRINFVKYYPPLVDIVNNFSEREDNVSLEKEEEFNELDDVYEK